MNNNVLISVIIPMFNAAQYIEKCIRSIMNGIYKNIEILCIDDGSTDDTLLIVEKIAAEDNRIQVFIQKNKGVSSARNRGLIEADGEYVAFVDADDYVTEDYLSMMFQIAKEKNADIVNCGFFRGGIKMPLLQREDDMQYQCFAITEKEKNREIVNHVWRALYRRDICPLFKENVKIGEDQLFNIRILSEHKNIIAWKCTKRMYFHLWRAGSLFSSAGLDRYGRICQDILDDMDTLPTKKYAIIGAAKQALGFRYSIESSKANHEIKQWASEMIRKVRWLMVKSTEIPLTEKVMYLPFLYSGRLYQLYRRKR